MGRNAQVPDESRIETQLWFYYQAASYIDIGFEGIHFGQVEIMNKNDRDNAQWEHLFNLVRAHAAKNARRHMVLLNVQAGTLTGVATLTGPAPNPTVLCSGAVTTGARGRCPPTSTLTGMILPTTRRTRR